MSHKNSDIYEKLIDKEQNKNTAIAGHSSGHSVHGGNKGNGSLLSRIEDVKSSKEFLEECTYFIGLKGT